MMSNYQILPFRFSRFDNEHYLLTNDVGEYIFLKNDDFAKFVSGNLDPRSDLFFDIASKQIATTDNVYDVVKMLATKFRTKKVSCKISHRFIWLFQRCDAIQVVSIAK